MVRDGEPHGTITLIAVGSGILAACLLLFFITSLVYKKEKEESNRSTNASKIPVKSPQIDESLHYFTNLDFTLDDESRTTQKKSPQSVLSVSATTL